MYSNEVEENRPEQLGNEEREAEDLQSNLEAAAGVVLTCLMFYAAYYEKEWDDTVEVGYFLCTAFSYALIYKYGKQMVFAHPRVMNYVIFSRGIVCIYIVNNMLDKK